MKGVSALHLKQEIYIVLPGSALIYENLYSILFRNKLCKNLDIQRRSSCLYGKLLFKSTTEYHFRQTFRRRKGEANIKLVNKIFQKWLLTDFIHFVQLVKAVMTVLQIISVDEFRSPTSSVYTRFARMRNSREFRVILKPVNLLNELPYWR